MSPAGQAAASGALTVDAVVERGSFRLEVGLAVRAGEVLAVLGPNGAGKSTLLRTLAGLGALTAGAVRLGAQTWDDPRADVFVPASERGIGLVFQDYRLFPHLTVLDNVAFAAQAGGARRPVARAGAASWLTRTGLDDLARRRPAELSGGEAQRVALARALAGGPRLLLLDEPLAALDARTRLEVRAELGRHLADFAGPCVLVTHDPLDAMVLADRLVVLEEGRVVQRGAPADVARRPATDYVARLVGLNLYRGTWAGDGTGRVPLAGGGELRACLGASRATADDPGSATQVPLPAGAAVLVVVAPSAIAMQLAEPAAGSARHAWSGVVAGLDLLTDRVRVVVEGAVAALVDVTPATVAELGLAPGRRVWLTTDPADVTAYPDPAYPDPAYPDPASTASG